MEHHIQDFRRVQDQLAEVKEKYSQGSGGVTSLARELANISEELESVKAEMDQRGTSMTDAGPLVKIKQALTRLKAESTQMEIRIGVVSESKARSGCNSSITPHAGGTHPLRRQPEEQVSHQAANEQNS